MVWSLSAIHKQMCEANQKCDTKTIGAVLDEWYKNRKYKNNHQMFITAFLTNLLLFLFNTLVKILESKIIFKIITGLAVVRERSVRNRCKTNRVKARS